MVPIPDRFTDELQGALKGRSLIRLIMSKPREVRKENQESENLKSIIITPVLLKRGYRLRFVYRYPTKDITKNVETGEGSTLIRHSLENHFFNADLFTTSQTIQLATFPNGKVSLSVRQAEGQKNPELSHDRMKDRMISTQGNIYLRELGVLNDKFELRREMSDKFIQINRYIELLKPHLETLKTEDTLRVVDMGSGKGYLTFALYDFLRSAGINALVTGVEQRPELVARSNEIADQCGFSGLKFVPGTIREFSCSGTHVLIALHACDTATDDAIFSGITSRAGLIVVAPCCHKQVRKSIKAPEYLRAVYSHGVFTGRQAELLTDVLRVLALEAAGYKTTVTEFVDAAHTPKNAMIIGSRNKSSNKLYNRKLNEAKALMSLFGISNHLLLDLMESAGFNDRM